LKFANNLLLIIISLAVVICFRGVQRLVDKGQHGESLADFESLVLWLSLAATPLHFISSAVNGKLVLGAQQQGRTFSSSMRMFATVLNFSTLGLDSVMLSFGLANLINKAINKELTTLDTLQFSMSVFFFMNTLMQPKVASDIIHEAQKQHFDRHMNRMTDPEAKASFQKFLDQNQNDGSINSRAKVVRTINRMQDPNSFFKGVGENAKVDIGGRKGKTVLVTDKHGDTTRMNPNKTIVSQSTNPSNPPNFKQAMRKLKKSYTIDPNEVELNGQKIFQNMDDRQKRRIGKVFGGSAKCNKDIVAAAHAVAESMHCTTANELMSIVEIVVSEVKGKSGPDLTTALNHIEGAGKTSFIDSINRDIKAATECAQKGGLHFESPLIAVYHYRKHGAEFPKAFMKFGNRFEVFVGPVQNEIFRDSNLREVCRLQDGIVRKIYATADNHYGVITSTPNGAKISTIFQNPGCNQDFIHKLAEYFKNATGPSQPVSDVAQRLARYLGLGSLQVYITIDGKTTCIDKCTNMDLEVHQQIAHLLTAIDEAI
jgi:hypothetical protein